MERTCINTHALQRLVRPLMTLLLMVSMILVAGCNKEELDQPVPEVNINPNYVRIDWGGASVVYSDDSSGDNQIQFNGTIPDIHPGSVITIDEDTVVHHLFVMSATVSGQTMTISSTPADLTDIFTNTDFTLSTAARGKSSAKGAVFYPVAAYLEDDNGKSIQLDLLRKDDTRFTHDIWKFELNRDGMDLVSGEHFRLFMQKMNFNFDLDIELGMNFGGRTAREFINNALERYRSKMLSADASLIGTTTIEQMIRCDITGSCSYDQGYEILWHNLFPKIRIRFVVNGVPIVLSINNEICRQVKLSAEGRISAYTGFADTSQRRIGFVWKQGEGIKPNCSSTTSTGLTPPTVEGKGQIQAKAWVFPRIRIMIYGITGPSFDIKPYLADTLRGGFREQSLGNTNDYCAWTFDGHAGIDANFGWSFSVLNMEYEADNEELEDWNIVDWKLFHSPKKVVYVDGATAPGRTGTVQFAVFDQNYLLNREVLTSLPQIVKFEAQGQLSSQYAICRDGVASVRWMPVENDVLYAKLYNADGVVISQDTVHPHTNGGGGGGNDGDWVELGLPSGLLWATRNVGASSPEDYGDYFAWGETSPKTDYSWSTYRYCNGSNRTLTKYCSRDYFGLDGFTDNLTTLVPADDAATANWSNGARTATRAEWLELIDNTTATWTTRNGVYGRLFTAVNGNSIFLPAAGYRHGTSLNNTGILGYYCSSSLESSCPEASYVFYFDYGDLDLGMGLTERCLGRSVRPVRSGNSGGGGGW